MAGSQEQGIDPFAVDRAQSVCDVLNGPIEDLEDDSIPELREPIVDGICREGEVVNFISASKMGKSLLVHDLAYSVATGKTWLDTFEIPKARRVLILDNELHKETLKWRLHEIGKSRGDLSAFQKPADIGVGYKSIRGAVPSIYQLPTLLNRIDPRTYGLIIFDAFYRFLPNGTSENDNGQMTQIYNALDSMASRLRSAIVLIHHSSKGDQSQKSKVDVGSGAGAMARAADSHIIIRDHEEDGHVLIEGETRSFKTPSPMSLQREGLRWHKSELAPRIRKANGRTASNDQRTEAAIYELLHKVGAASKNEIFNALKGTNATIGNNKLPEVLSRLVKDKKIVFNPEDRGPTGKAKGTYSIPMEAVYA